MDKAPDKYLEFEIEKTYVNFAESEKTIASAFLTYLLLMCLCALLIFGTGIVAEDKFTVPLLGLVVNKSYASVIVLILSCGALYWLTASLLHSNLLLSKVRILLRNLYKYSPEKAWYLRHPSFFTSSMMILAMPAQANWLLAIYGLGVWKLISFIYYFVPLFFAWKIASLLVMSSAQRVIFCSFILFLLFPTMAINRMKSRHDAKTLIEVLERDLSFTGDNTQEGLGK